MTDKHEAPTKREALEKLIDIAHAVKNNPPEAKPEPIGGGHHSIDTIDFRDWIDPEEVTFLFESGEYRVEFTDGEPSFVQVND